MAEIQISFRGKGFKDLANALGVIVPRKNREAVKETLDFMLDEVNSLARLYCPVRTGHLRSTIQVLRFDDFQGMIEAYADYAGFVEYGTSRMRAQPYLRPAWMQIWPLVLNILRERLVPRYNEVLPK
jgi:HK97 gp10 family phage protein